MDLRAVNVNLLARCGVAFLLLKRMKPCSSRHKLVREAYLLHMPAKKPTHSTAADTVAAVVADIGAQGLDVKRETRCGSTIIGGCWGRGYRERVPR